MAEHSMNEPDPTQDLTLGIPFYDEHRRYIGRVEIISYEYADMDPDLRVSVSGEDSGSAHIRRSMTPAELREFAGALERAADHADAVRESARKGPVAA